MRDAPTYIHLVIGLFLLGMGLCSRSAGEEDRPKAKRFKAYAVLCLGVPVVVRFIAFSISIEGWGLWPLAWLLCTLVTLLYLFACLISLFVIPRPVVSLWLMLLAAYTSVLLVYSIPME